MRGGKTGTQLVLNDISHKHLNEKHHQSKTQWMKFDFFFIKLWYLPVTYSEGGVDTMNKIYGINGLCLHIQPRSGTLK